MSMRQTPANPVFRRSIPDLIADSGASRPESPALWRCVDGRFEAVTYGQLLAAVAQIADRLKTHGAGPDRRVAIWVTDRFSWGIIYLGVLWTGATAVPIDPTLTPAEVQAIVGEADATLMIADGFDPSRASFGPGVNVVPLRELWPEFVRQEPLPSCPLIDPDSLAAILFTSGTTGTTKGVMLTHQNIVSDIAAIRDMDLLYDDDLLLSVLPIHHAFECTAGFLYPLSIGAQVAYARSLKSNEILEDLKTTRATVILGVPLLFEKMQKGILRRVAEVSAFRQVVFEILASASRLARRTGIRRAGRILFWPIRRHGGLDSLRLLVSGGAALPSEVAEFFDTIGLPLVQGYGLSEAAPVVTVNRPRAYRYDSVGPPLPGVEVRINNPCPDGMGEVAVRGPMVMRGYWRRPQETAAVLSDGWLLTGDLGSIDPDGHLRIVGRSKNVIISGAGKNIYPEEIEAVLMMQPEIAEAVVYGLCKPRKIGETVAAIIVPEREWFAATHPEAADDPAAIRPLIQAAIDRTCLQLAPFKRVVEWQLRLDPFEKTATRKVKRYLVIGDRMSVRPIPSTVPERNISA